MCVGSAWWARTRWLVGAPTFACMVMRGGALDGWASGAGRLTRGCWVSGAAAWSGLEVGHLTVTARAGGHLCGVRCEVGHLTITGCAHTNPSAVW